MAEQRLPRQTPEVTTLAREQLETLVAAHRNEFISTCVAHERADEEQAREALDDFEATALKKGRG